MRPTPLGRAAGLVAIGLFGLAFVLGTIAPALAALVLLAFREAAQRIPVVTLTAHREAPEMAVVGEPFETTLHVSSDPAVPLVAGAEGHGVLVASETIVPATPGRMVWEDATVEVRDPWGLWGSPCRVQAPAMTRVAPEGTLLTRGRRHGQRNMVQATAKDPLASEPQPEVMQVRPYQAGDRTRDIDWRITERTGEVHSRQRERAAPRRIIVFIDASRSMRRPARISKLRTSAEVAVGIAGAAQGAGVSAAVVVAHEEGVETVARSSRMSARDVLQGLSRLPSVEGHEGIRLTTDLDRAVTRDERRFLHLVAPLADAPVPAAPSLDGGLDAVQRAAGGPALVVAIMDGEINPRRAEVAVGRLQRMGHHVVLIVPATGPHHCTKQDAPIQDLREALARRERLSRSMAVHKAKMLVLRPGEEEDVVREVSRSAV